jgi:hypothetical protein
LAELRVNSHRPVGIKNWRGVASRYDKLAVVFGGSAILSAIVDWLR